MNKPKILLYDIETAPCLGWFWRVGRPQSLNPGNVIRPGKIICISYRWSTWSKRKPSKIFSWKPKKRTNRFSYEFSDKQLLVDFAKIAEDADILIGHNGDQFDYKTLNSRYIYYDMPALHHVTEDTLKHARRLLNLPSLSLAFLTKYFNLPGKMSTEVGLWQAVVFDGSKKKLKVMERYCKNDTTILHHLWDKLFPYIKMKISLGVFNGTSDICPKCGSAERTNKGYRYTAAGKFRDYKCKSCSSRYKDGKNLLKDSSSIGRT